MKTLKKTIALTLALAAILSLAACGSKPSAPAQTEENIYDDFFIVDTPVEQETEPATEPVPAGEKYESEHLSVYGATAETKDIFSHYADNEQNIICTTDGRLIHADDLSDTFWFEGEDVQSVQMAWETVAYTDSKGFTYVRMDGKIFPCQDIRGEIFWGFVGMLDGELVLCSREEDGTMYINSIDRTGVKTRDNEQLYLRDFTNEIYMDHVDTIRFVVDDQIQPNIYAEVDGTAYYYNVTGISFFDKKPQIWVSGRACWDANNVMDYGFGGAGTVLYKNEGDNTALYYKQPYGETELPVFMPDGKTVDQLTRAVFGQTTYLFFEDGSVYAGELVNTVVGPDMELDQVLTELNEKGAIKDVFQSTYLKNNNCQLRLLMDDNVTYDYNP